MKKQLLAFVAVFCCTAFISANADPISGTCGKYLTWEIVDDTLTISGTGEMDDYTYYTQAPWYSDRSSFHTAVIEDGVTSIGNYAFYSNSLTSVILDDNLTSIGEYAFSWNRELAAVEIPNSVKEIKKGAFQNCGKLAVVNVTDIDAWCNITFGDSYANPVHQTHSLSVNGEPVGDVVLSDKVTKINDYAFYYCLNLTSIVLPDGIAGIGINAFYYCNNLTTINIPNGVESIGKFAFEYCSQLESIEIPNSVTSIGEQAFYYCRGMSSVKIGDGITRLEAKTFQFCASLQSVIIGENVSVIGDDVFYECRNLPGIELPHNVTSIGDYAFGYCPNLIWVNIPDKVESIGKSAFYQSGINMVSLPANLVSIGDYAFGDCGNLTSIEVAAANANYSSKDGVLFNKDKTTIIQYPKGARDVSYTIPQSVTNIEKYAFYNCSHLSSITIPENVISIGTYAFHHCTNLVSLSVPNGVTTIGSNAFTNVANVIYSGEATGSPWGARCVNGFVDGWLVYNNETKTEVCACSPDATGKIVLPNTVTRIGDYAFQNCDKITAVEISKGVTSIGNYAFSYCVKLASVNIPEGVTSIGYYAFRKCALTSITIPNSVTKIFGYAFSECTSLHSLVIGSGIEEISDYAFEACTGLRSIICAAVTPPTKQGKNIFDKVDKSIPLYVPAESIEKYRNATEWKKFTDIRPIEAEEVAVDEPQAQPEEYSVVIEWPKVVNADIYTIIITNGEDTIRVITFSKDGQLLSIAYAPRRGGNSRHPQMALQTDTGWKYTVSDLETNTNYVYKLVALNDSGEEIYTRSVPFKTGNTTTAIDRMESDDSQMSVKILHNGQLYILREGKMYDLTGKKL